MIATASGSHGAVAGAAIDAGVAVIVEKPIATSAAAARSLVAQAAARVLGDRAAYIVDQLDAQEEALRAGLRPGEHVTDVEPPERWGRLRRGDTSEPVPSIAGRWLDFYASVISSLRLHGRSRLTSRTRSGVS